MLALTCVGSGAVWVLAVAWRRPRGRLSSAARALIGGATAFAAAWGGYALADHAGLRLSWETVLAGGAGAIATAAGIGLVEEGAKLLGLLLASAGARRGSPGGALHRVLGLSAVFACLECAVVLPGAEPGVLLLRCLLSPVAHAALASPLALALAGGPTGWRRVIPALLVAAALHGASDLSLALPALGRLGYATVLAAPVVFLHLRDRSLRSRAEGRQPAPA